MPPGPTSGDPGEGRGPDRESALVAFPYEQLGFWTLHRRLLVVDSSRVRVYELAYAQGDLIGAFVGWLFWIILAVAGAMLGRAISQLYTRKKAMRIEGQFLEDAEGTLASLEPVTTEYLHNVVLEPAGRRPQSFRLIRLPNAILTGGKLMWGDQTAFDFETPAAARAQLDACFGALRGDAPSEKA